jgi:hypothetical protein
MARPNSGSRFSTCSCEKWRTEAAASALDSNALFETVEFERISYYGLMHQRFGYTRENSSDRFP